jgi:L-alanine-DL-glutamate epimerase-like enolase superfamily enzyme
VAVIARIEVFPAIYPVVGYFKFFEGPRGAYGRAAVFVKITADDGTVGWGQSAPSYTWSDETLETAAIVIRDYLAPTLIGRDPTDIAAAHAAMDRGLASGFTLGMPIARSGLDYALHDLAGKLLGQSVAELWGRAPGGTITLSWTVNVRTLDEAEPLLDAGWRRGYRHFNIKVGPDLEFDVELARVVRRFAPEGFLWADANGGYELETALAAAPKLADAGVDVLESPLKPNRLRGYQKLVRQAALPILMDEGVISPIDLEEFIALGMLDGVAMKASRTGGLHYARRQIEILVDRGLMWLGSGLCDPDIALAAHLALYAAYGLDRPAALNGPQFLQSDVLAAPLDIVGDQACAPVGPGLGVAVDDERVSKLAVRSV